jgi:hypothetical protein
MTRLKLIGLALTLLLASAAPVAAARPPDCTLRLDVERVHQVGEPVVIHVSGLTGKGGIDIFISWRNRTDEAHLFLVPGITEFDFVYPLAFPGEDPPLLDPGRYRVHATDIACEVRTGFRVVR